MSDIRENKSEDFELQFKKIIQDLGVANEMVLSTSYNDRVTSRMMSVIANDNNLYFQTDKLSRKYNQISKNPKVALCINNLQLEGVCKNLGHPLENEVFCELYKKNFASSYKNYSHLLNEIVFVCELTYIKKWVYENGIPYQEVFDILNKKYIKEKYVCE